MIMDSFLIRIHLIVLLIVEQYPPIQLQLVDVLRLLLELLYQLLLEIPILFLQLLALQLTLKITDLFPRQLLNREIMVGYLELVLSYVHMEPLILQVLLRLTMLRTLLPLVTQLVVRLVLVSLVLLIHSGLLHITV